MTLTLAAYTCSLLALVAVAAIAGVAAYLIQKNSDPLNTQKKKPGAATPGKKRKINK